ncbi:MAG: oxidoreductase [Chloroflexota bacterium]|nr:oxidoreductase [Anaerolineales bacterium]
MTSIWTAENIPDLTGKVAIVTGANSGIGYETARALAGKRAIVILACRNREKGDAAIRQICQENPRSKIELLQLDLGSLASVRCFVDEFTSRYARLDILINNAGIMAPPFGKTVDGFEIQFGTNHLGHFALTGLLLNLITDTPKSRVVTVGSSMHLFGKMDFDNLKGEKHYQRQSAYAQSKLANLLFAYELQRRFDAAKVDAISVAAHPGWTETNLQVHWRALWMVNSLAGQKPQMGALPTLYAATAFAVRGGEYYGPRGLQVWGYPTRVRSNHRSYDIEVAARLWAVSERLTGVRYALLSARS